MYLSGPNFFIELKTDAANVKNPWGNKLPTAKNCNISVFGEIFTIMSKDIKIFVWSKPFIELKTDAASFKNPWGNKLVIAHQDFFWGKIQICEDQKYASGSNLFL